MERRLLAAWNTVPGLIPLAMSRRFAGMSNARMTLRNTYLTSEIFRKVHVEHAECAGDLEVVHHVAFPHSTYDLPIFGVDLLTKRRKPLMGIADISGDTPDWVARAVCRLQEKHGLDAKTQRTLPAWGAEIFSERCVFLDEPDESFAAYVSDVLDVYIQHSLLQRPKYETQRGRREEQRRYCFFQMQNDRTRNVLRNAFGSELAESYMQEIMFDVI